jgi:hypothetical protein
MRLGAIAIAIAVALGERSQSFGFRNTLYGKPLFMF